MKTYVLTAPRRAILKRLVARGFRRNGKAWLKGRLVARFLCVDKNMLCVQRIPFRKKSYSPFEDSPEYHENFA